MELIHPIVEIIKLLWGPIAHRVNYFAKIGENMDHLRSQVEELTAAREDLKKEVERAACEGKDPKNEVQVWLKKADEIINETEEMQEEFQQNKRCFYGWCLDCRSRYKLGKRIVTKTTYVKDRNAQKDSFREIAGPPLRKSGQELPTAAIREGTSAMDVFNKACNRVMDGKGIIGIWGKGGIGKTRLAKNINNKFCRTSHFEKIIFVTVSRDGNIKKLRNDIGKEIEEEFGKEISAEQDERRTSALLFNKLKGKRFLLILDDMWEKVDLEQLGVPSPKENGGSIIVITTRSRSVCNDMETDEEIMVEVLSDTEAWELFQEKASRRVISSDIEPIARDVYKECRGLPLAIIVVGRALRKETDREVWKNALRVLRTSQFELKGMEREVYLPLKFSYDHLETDTLRNCFLYCSLFPEDYEIEVDQLIGYWIMEGFIQGVQSLEDAEAKGHSLLKELVDSCLLEHDGRWKYYVRMHDVIRDMAIRITSESTERGMRFLVRAGVGLEDCPKVEEWEGKDRISLMENDIRFSPDEPKCSELSTLLLRGNELLEEIPPSFFKQMKNLRVLDLSRTEIVSLPPSISELGGLQALILRNCRSLQSVTCVGGLKHLQLLDLSNTDIEELPREIGQLTRLRRLDLSEIRYLAYIPADIILSLSLLEDLEMIRSSIFCISNESKAFIENLRYLNHLTHFTADIPNDLCTSSQWEFLLGDKLKSFRLRIGDRDALLTLWTSHSKRRDRRLHILENTNVSQEAVGLLQYAEILDLYDHDEVRTISAMGARNLMRLKACSILRCNHMESVVIAEEAEEGILPELETLYLHELQNLRRIWEGNGTPGSFGRIKNITLRNCPKVMHLFSSNVLQLLNSLEELDIYDCDRMVEIVSGEVGNGVIALPRLRLIVLEKLPKLKRMWKGVLSLESLKEIEVTSCSSLRQLAISIDKTRALEAIRGEREWWDSLKWQNDNSKSHFQKKCETI